MYIKWRFPIRKERSERGHYSQEKRLTMFETFERLIYNEVFTHYIKNCLTSRSQLGFRPRNSFVNQTFLLHMLYINPLILDLAIELPF